MTVRCLISSSPKLVMQNKNNVSSPLKWEELVPGYEFPPASYELSASAISRYLEAVDRQDKWQVSSLSGFVPPMAIATYAMTAMSKSLIMPPGAIHTSEELEFHKPVPVGTTVSCHAKVGRKMGRGKFQMLVIELSIINEDDEEVVSGKASIVLAG